MIRELQSAFLNSAKTATATDRCALAEEVTGYFNELRNSLLRYLLSFGLTVHDGEEVIQEVFLLLFQHLRRNGSRSNLRGWLFRVAHNQGLKRCNFNRVETKLFFPADERTGEGQFDPDPNPEEILLSRQREMRLRAVVEELPETDRRCLYLRAEGLRYRDIVRILGISLAGVALSLERSLARLRRADLNG